MNRRSFIVQSAAFGALATLPSFFANCASRQLLSVDAGIGIQLYSVRELFAKQSRQLFKKISSIGFSHIETFGWSSDRSILGYTISDFAQLLAEYNLQTHSGHYYIPEVIYEKQWHVWKNALDDATALGQKYVIIPWVDVEKLKQKGGVYHLIEVINQAATYCQQAGLKCAYHNHAFEFEEQIDGKPWMDHLLENTPDNVCFEADLYWVKAAGKGIRTFLEKYQNRIHLWHIKDMHMHKENTTVAVGNGSINYQHILLPKYAAQLQYPIYEQEHGMNTPADAYQAMGDSYAYIKQFISKRA